MSLIGSIVSKLVILSQNSTFLVKMVKIGSFWGQKWCRRSKFWGRTKIFFLKTVFKIMVIRFIIITLVKSDINAVNLVKIGHFLVKMVKLDHFVKIWRPRCRNMSKFLESGPIIFSLEILKLSIRSMDINVVNNVINGFNLVKIGQFRWKWSKLGHCGGQNDVICLNLGKVVK